MMLFIMSVARPQVWENRATDDLTRGASPPSPEALQAASERCIRCLPRVRPGRDRGPGPNACVEGSSVDLCGEAALSHQLPLHRPLRQLPLQQSSSWEQGSLLLPSVHSDGGGGGGPGEAQLRSAPASAQMSAIAVPALRQGAFETPPKWCKAMTNPLGSVMGDPEEPGLLSHS